jgi:hypothetical protein
METASGKLYCFKKKSFERPTDFAAQYESHEMRGELNLISDGDYVFPEPDFLEEVVKIYFREVNSYLPLLNEFLFKRQISEGLHLTDKAFGAVVLLVSALGSRPSNDPRAYMDPSAPQSRGWQWFTQVQYVQCLMIAPATLHDIQILAVSWNRGFYFFVYRITQ